MRKIRKTEKEKRHVTKGEGSECAGCPEFVASESVTRARALERGVEGTTRSLGV